MTEKLNTTSQVSSPDQLLESAGEHTPARTVQMMERLHASEVFKTPEHSKAFLDSLTYEEFKKYLSLVNGLELGLSINERGKAGNSLVQSDNAFLGSEVAYRPPHSSRRDSLLEKAFIKAQSLESPEVAGLTLGLAINAIHYFDDGNGRTARMTYALLSRGYDGTPEANDYYSSILENTKGREVINPNPAASGIDKRIRNGMFGGAQYQFGYVEAFGKNLPTFIYDGYGGAYAGEYTAQALELADNIDDDTRQLLYETMESGGMTMVSLMATFSPDRIKDFVKTSPDGARTSIQGSEFLPTLTKEEIIEWYKTSERAITAYVQKLINFSDRKDADEIVAFYRGTSPETTGA